MKAIELLKLLCPAYSAGGGVISIMNHIHLE